MDAGCVLGVVLMCGMFVGMSEVAAQEKPIELTYASQYQISPLFRSRSTLIAKIEKETNGRVKIKPFWAEPSSRAGRACVK